MGDRVKIITNLQMTEKQQVSNQNLSDEDKVKLAVKAAHDEFMKTIPAGSRMRVTRDEKQMRKREYNKRPEVKERRRMYDQRPHVKLKRWLKNHSPQVVLKRKAYSARDDVKVRRYIVTQRRRQLGADCVKLLTEHKLKSPDSTSTYYVEKKRLINETPEGKNVIHKLKSNKNGWLTIPVGSATDYDNEMFDGNLHEKESSEVLQLIKEYYERASNNNTVPTPEPTPGGSDHPSGDDSSDSSDSDEEWDDKHPSNKH